MAVTLYGIKNCDTVKKARRYLDSHNVEYAFHDYRKDGIDQKLVQSFVNAFGWESVLNKRGTTWRGLSDKQKESTDASNVVALLCEHPAMIKRPILKHGKKMELGFSEASYSELFK